VYEYFKFRLNMFCSWARDCWELMFALHIAITALMILSGPALLEPMAALWLLSPAVPYILVGIVTDKWTGLRSYRRMFFFVIWLLTLTLGPWLCWSTLVSVDEGFLRPLRTDLVIGVALFLISILVSSHFTPERRSHLPRRSF
jgi:hypothetical protein